MSDQEAGILLAAGGTGGHLFPAEALAEELARRGVSVDLVTDMRGHRYGGHFPGRDVYEVPSATLAGRSPIAMTRTAHMLGKGVVEAHKLLGRIRPRAVIGFGGYPTFPPVLAARLRGIPTAVHEQNAVLGRANRMLARYVKYIATSFEKTKFLTPKLASKARLTGNPVRSLVINCARRPYWGPDSKDVFKLLVFGGSQGAHFFAEAVPKALSLLPDEVLTRLNVVQQARPEDLDEVFAIYDANGIRAEVSPFFDDLPRRISDAHLVISRSGASTVGELTVIGRPSILVPLPHAVDNDQLQNATRLAESGGAWCIEQKDLTPERLAHEVAVLANDPNRLSAAAVAARKQGRPDAVERLADLAVELMGQS